MENLFGVKHFYNFNFFSPVSVFQTHSQASTYPRERRRLVSRQAAKHEKKMHQFT